MFQLEETNLKPDPFDQFDLLYKYAQNEGQESPEAMALATSTKNGSPSTRFVLLNGVSDGCFIFFTNYDSKKGDDLKENPKAALAIYWPKVNLQIRAEGNVALLSADQSNSYFSLRNRESQISAWASQQSKIVPNRSYLEQKWKEFDSKFEQSVPRPPNWGGFMLEAKVIEFWRSREHRLHDRIRYTLQNKGHWCIQRLSP
jgi:pyridoxamine 5'-phosphate oxidase